jgi:hypothetical protein
MIILGLALRETLGDTGVSQDHPRVVVAAAVPMVVVVVVAAGPMVVVAED